jgi:ankyrin repeat protein
LLNIPCQSFDSPLHQAALVGDIDVLDRLVKQGLDINLPIDRAADDYGYLRQLTPLMVAALSNQGATVATVKWLVEHGADVNARSMAENTAIWYAIAFWYIDDRGILQGDRRNPTLVAEQLARFRYLLSISQPSDLDRLLCEVCEAGAVEAAALLLELGVAPVPTALVPLTVFEGESDDSWLDYPDVPIVLAAKSGVVECVELLLKAGADPNSYDNLSYTPLMVAATPAIVELLIAAGANIQALTKSGNDVFGEQLEHLDRDLSQTEQILELLLAAGVDIEQRNEYGWTRLYTSSFIGSEFGVDFLLRKGAKSEDCTRDNKGGTPLHAVCWCGGKDRALIIERLLAAGVDINSRDGDGNTPLHTAASQAYGCTSSDESCPDLIEILLARGAEINAINLRGETPLIATVKGDYFYELEFRSLEILLGAGANREIRDGDGKKAIDYVRQLYNLYLDVSDLATLSDLEFASRCAGIISEHDRDDILRLNRCLELLL